MPTESVEVKRQNEEESIGECAAKSTHCTDDRDKIHNPDHVRKSIREKIIEFWIEMGQLTR